MKRIDIVNGILYYYGNPAGCVSGETAILDTMFQKEELIQFFNRKRDRESGIPWRRI